MEKNSVASLLTSVDSLFTTQEERDIATQPRVQEIPLDQIDDFPNHPFKVRLDDNMVEMAESIKQHGVLVPAVVRPKENGRYEMVAIALSCNPELIIADEPTTALDVTIQAQILDLLKELKDKMSSSIMLITHDLGVVANMADSK